jgi:hypothetical protein
MSAAALLSRLDRVKRTGVSRWVALCPAHLDKTPSLSICEKDDGRVLVHCFADCPVQDVLDAAGVDMAELFPPRPLKMEGIRPERRPWIPSDAFDVLRHEATIVFLIGADLHKNKTVSEEDYQRLLVATDRLENIAGGVYGR